jgi:hypothetical protein
MSVSEGTTRAELSEQAARMIGVDAYIYLYPLVLMELTRRQTTNAPTGARPGFGPMGVFFHIREFPAADFKAVVRPNFDTLYSIAWLDLTGEPMVASVPDTDDRYYLLPMLDIVWIIGRTQTNGPADYQAVHQVQDGMTITPLSRRGQAPTPVEAHPDPSVDMQTPPLDQVNAMSARDFFDHDALDPAVRGALDGAPPAALALMRQTLPHVARVVNGWQMNTDTMGVYGNFYLKRAIVAMAGLGANPPEDAVYPLNVADADGRPLTGDQDYRLHFDQDELPPSGRSGRSRCTTPTASRPPTRWTGSPSATAMTSPTTRTAPSTCTCSTTAPARSVRPTGCRRPEGRWG